MFEFGKLVNTMVIYLYVLTTRPSRGKKKFFSQLYVGLYNCVFKTLDMYLHIMYSRVIYWYYNLEV